MRTKLFFSLLALLFCTSTFAQDRNPDERRKNIEQYKKEYIKDELNLSASEEEKFWPIYDQYQDEMESFRNDKRMDLSLMSDKEAEDFLNESIDIERKKLDIKEKYIAKFRTVLNSRKVLKLTRLEHEFKKKLLMKYKDKVSGRKQRMKEEYLKKKGK